MAETGKQTLLMLVGGERQVNRVVDALYQSVMADELVAPFFADIDLERQRAHMVRFLVAALNEDAFSVEMLRNAHARQVREAGLTDVHFDRIGEHIVAALKQAQLHGEIIDEIVDLLESLRPIVLNR